MSGAKSKQLRRLTYRLVLTTNTSEPAVGKPYRTIILEMAAVPPPEDDFEASSQLETSCSVGLQKHLHLLTPDRYAV
jgi:hypothetical protein